MTNFSEKTYERRLISLLVGAGAAMIAVTTAILYFSIEGFAQFSFQDDGLLVRLLTVSSIATLLIMSTLHSQLRDLYGVLASTNDQAWEEARRDSLTGLGNRTLILERLSARLVDRRARGEHALFFLDLDQFKRVNDTLGHQVGDALIQAVAGRLASLEKGTTIARLGGDEFALLMEVGDKNGISAAGQRIMRLLSGKYQLEEAAVSVGVSIGATSLSDARNLSAAMQQADIAMYAAKNDGGGFRLFDQQMSVHIERRALIESRLLQLIEQNGNKGDCKASISTMFQPVVTSDGSLVAAEALLRYKDDDLGSVSPQEVIAVAEQSHLMADLGQIMARSAFCAARAMEHASVCLNVSPVELLDPEYPEKLARLARSLRVDPSRIQIEISERSLLERGDAVAETLAALRSVGFVLSVDDFGSSVASVNHLSDHDISIVKIDAQLVRNAKRARSVAVLDSLVRLVESHDISVVCEGVADSEDEAIAIATGCTHLQGFHYSRPRPLVDLLEIYSDSGSMGQIQDAA